MALLQQKLERMLCQVFDQILKRMKVVEEIFKGLFILNPIGYDASQDRCSEMQRTASV